MAGGTVVYLVRHGESLGNVIPGLGRSEDPALTERGRAQAALVAGALTARGIDAVLTSPLRRARETAAAIGAAAILPFALVEGFHEVDMGALAEPRTAEERAERASIFSSWLAGDYGRGFPGGEDFAALLLRVRSALAGVLSSEEPGSRVAVVTHRMPIAAAAILTRSGEATFVPGACANGSITTFTAEDGARLRLVGWADAAHLP
jgi:ribonuclease H / adenosylcobalamin/alpha-ribazole phosphatase